MPRGGSRPGAGRPRKVPGESAKTFTNSPHRAASDQSPLDYMLAIMRDPTADTARRDRMALAAAAYVHPRGGIGKKETAQETARAVGKGRFATPPTPLRLIPGSKP
jgi:hypothetical protein